MAAFESSQAAFAALLDPLEVDLVHLRYRWESTKLFLIELRAVAHDRPFEIHDGAAWTWIVDAQNMLAIRLEDWTNQLLDEGGFFDTLVSTPGLLSELGAESPEGQPVDAALETRRLLTLEDRLGATGPVRPEHLDALRRDILRHMPPLAIDHRADRDDPEENPGSLLHQVHAALDEQLRYAERLCEDLRLCARAPAFSRPHLPRLTPVAARALIDIILLGPNYRTLDHADVPEVTFATPAPADRRARAYAALHVATPDPHSPFNTAADLARTLHLDLTEVP